MSGGVGNLQAQVESVLGALVKVAAAELTKLFEGTYRGSAVDVDVGRTEDVKEKKTFDTLDCLFASNSKRSIGVQVDADVDPPSELNGPRFCSDGDCLKGCRVEEVGDCLIPPEVLLVQNNGLSDPEWELLKEQDVAETVDMVELSVLETEAPVYSQTTEVVLHGKEQHCDLKNAADTRHDEKASPVKQKPLVIQHDTRAVTSGDKVKFVCPLILKPESPAAKPDSSEKPAQAEPQQASVSTAKGTAYSPSPSDGAVTPAQVGVWERIHTPKEAKNHLQMKLKLTSPDQKLMRPCAVQLVNLLTVPQTEAKLQDESHGANGKTGWPLPKDLRRHQGLHTGHRLCCFTQCGNGVWRLQKVVNHSRDGYACSICRKTFKRRKILRRHERFHTGEKPYSCSTCSKTFALRKSLRRHLRFHTGERPHSCTHCGKSFRLRENLKAHLRFHTGEKPFDCATCGKTFRIVKNLEKHKLGQCEYFVPSFRTIAGL